VKLTPDKLSKLDGRTCFICGRYLLNYKESDMAYSEVHTGDSIKTKPPKYFLYECPECKKIAHLRCWYDVGENKIKKGWFKGSEFQLICPSCKTVLSPKRPKKTDWKHGYRIPSHPEEDLLELQVQDVISYKAGSVFGKIGKAIDSFFQAVGLGSVSDPERSSIARAAQRVGKTIQDVAERVFRIKITPEQRSELKELRCQNCGAPLPTPGEFDDAIVCAHCGTAHLLKG